MSEGYSFRIASVAAVAWFAVLFVVSDNIHSLAESTSYDRLLLGARMCHGEAIDPNFPLGSAFLYSLPCRFGLEPVIAGRLVSLGFALLACFFAVRILRELEVPAAFGPWVLGLAALPAFARGAVVVGEEAAYTAAILGAVLAVMRGRPVPVVFAANLAVLVRLDALTLLPLFAAGVVVSTPERRRGLALGAACFGTTLLHLGIGMRTGEPLGFARRARAVMASSADGFGGRPGLETLPIALLDALGGAFGALLLGVAAAATVALLRGGGPGRRLAAGTLGVVLVTWVLAAVGALEPRSPRMIVPSLVLLLLCAFAGAGRRRSWAWMLASGCLLVGVPRAWTQAQEARLSPGLVEAARSLRDRPVEERIVVTEAHPVVVVESRRRPDSVGLVRQGTDGARWLLEVSDAGTRLVDLGP